MSLAAKGRALVTWFLGVLLFLVLLLATSLLVLKTDWARAQVARRGSSFVSERVRGRIELGRLDRLSLSSIAAEDLKVIDAQGHTAIEAAEVRIEPDPSAWVRGRLVFRAEVERGTVHLRTTPNGDINLKDAFRPKTAPGDEPTAPQGSGASDGPPTIDIRIETSDMALALGGESMPSLRFEDVYGIMRVHNDDRGMWLQFDTYRGVITRGLPTGELPFEDVSGHVQTYGKRLLRFRGKGAFARNEVQFEIDMMDEPKRHVELHANFPELSAAAVASHAAEAYSALSEHIEVHVSHGR